LIDLLRKKTTNPIEPKNPFMESTSGKTRSSTSSLKLGFCAIIKLGRIGLVQLRALMTTVISFSRTRTASLRSVIWHPINDHRSLW